MRGAASQYSWERFAPHRIYFVIGGLATLFLCFLTPPFEVPDEPQHFYRGYQLSTGEFWGSVKNGQAGSVLPSSLPELVEHFLGTRASHAPRPLRPHRWSDTWAQFGRSLEPQRQEFVEFGGAVGYPPFGYAPQALTMAVARVFEAPPLVTLYAGRLANALIAVALIGWVLKSMTIGREVALVVALLPMSLFMTASVSQDALALPAAFIVTAVGLRFYCHPKWTRADFLIMLTAGLILCSAKPVYLPLMLIGLPAALKSAGDTAGARHDKRQLAIGHFVILTITVVLTLTWMHSNAGLTAPARPDVDASLPRQLAYVISGPGRFVEMLGRTAWERSYFYLLSTIGLLGWLNVLMPAWIYSLCIAAFFAAARWPAYGVPSAKPWLLVSWASIIIVGCVCLIQMAMYLLWEPVGAPAISGTQGRYFLPILPLAGAMIASLALADRKGASTKLSYGFVVIFLALTTLGMLAQVASSYEVFSGSDGNETAISSMLPERPNLESSRLC
jgi:uncharacterized membrane protein